jgi:hypothetical protein
MGNLKYSNGILLLAQRALSVAWNRHPRERMSRGMIRVTDYRPKKERSHPVRCSVDSSGAAQRGAFSKNRQSRVRAAKRTVQSKARGTRCAVQITQTISIAPRAATFAVTPAVGPVAHYCRTIQERK